MWKQSNLKAKLNFWKILNSNYATLKENPRKMIERKSIYFTHWEKYANSQTTIRSCRVAVIHFHSCISSDTVVVVLSSSLGNGHNPYLNIKIKGKVSAQPHTIVKQICFPNGNVLFLSLFPLLKNWMHNVVWGCAEILPNQVSSKTKSPSTRRCASSYI